jgi:hypothetical protein
MASAIRHFAAPVLFFLAACLHAQAANPELTTALDEKIYAKAFGKANLAQDKTAGATTGTKARRVKSRI